MGGLVVKIWVLGPEAVMRYWQGQWGGII